MKIYTRTGDAGQTGLFGGGRVPKDHPRVSAYGAVDELNAHLGVCLEAVTDADIRTRVRLVQHDLFTIGAELATPVPKEGRARPGRPDLPLARIVEMESWIDELDVVLPPLRAFILPGGTRGAAALHVARTVCRRAEREVVTLSEDDEVPEGVIRYLNRLSDTLFSFARLENQVAGSGDLLWEKPTKSEERR